MKKYFSIYYRIEPTFHEDDNLSQNIRLAGCEIPDTYRLVRTMEVENTLNYDGVIWENLESVWMQMQGECWSPEGEARPLIEALGLRHTSMSVGDLIVDRVTGAVYEACMSGFREVYNLLD